VIESIFRKLLSKVYRRVGVAQVYPIKYLSTTPPIQYAIYVILNIYTISVKTEIYFTKNVRSRYASEYIPFVQLKLPKKCSLIIMKKIYDIKLKDLLSLKLLEIGTYYTLKCSKYPCEYALKHINKCSKIRNCDLLF